jgi:hypothetical protein
MCRGSPSVFEPNLGVISSGCLTLGRLSQSGKVVSIDWPLTEFVDGCRRNKGGVFTPGMVPQGRLHTAYTPGPPSTFPPDSVGGLTVTCPHFPCLNSGVQSSRTA